MSNTDKTILVTGATGNQGGATAKQLLAKGYRVRALVRDAKSEKAQKLAALGIELIQGNMDDRASLDKAMQGVYGVFSVQNFWETGYEKEISQGKAVADAAKAAGVKHFVYTSVGGAERKSGLEHFESKYLIEEYVKSLGLPYTILRPVFFMDNLFYPDYFYNGIQSGQLVMSLTEGTKLQSIAVEDIGAFATMAFDKPEEFLGTATEIAGDELSGTEMADLLTKVMGKSVKYVEYPVSELMKVSEEWAKMYDWFNKFGYTADIPKLRKLHPSLQTLEQWLVKTGWGK